MNAFGPTMLSKCFEAVNAAAIIVKRSDQGMHQIRLSKCCETRNLEEARSRLTRPISSPSDFASCSTVSVRAKQSKLMCWDSSAYEVLPRKKYWVMVLTKRKSHPTSKAFTFLASNFRELVTRIRMSLSFCYSSQMMKRS